MTEPAAEASRKLRLLEGIGIEIETMLVVPGSLDVAPRVDELLAVANGGPVDDHDDGAIHWSNELVAHVIELKNAGPVPTFRGVARAFQESAERLVALAAPLGLRPMPGAMHPWMVPASETVLWPHDYAPVYAAYHRIFDCHRHGWANVQSTHLNLSFGDDAEFARLLAAVRLVLPWIPALAASSPVEGGRVQPTRDTRLVHYRHHADRVPELVGEVIPEPVYEPGPYGELVLRPISRHLAELDIDGRLAGRDWINGRGAIARFDRGAVEIRLIDAQECVAADVAVAAAVYGAVRWLTEEHGAPLAAQQAVESAPLVRQLEACVRDAERAPVLERSLAAAMGAESATCAGELWRAVVERSFPSDAELEPWIEGILRAGSLSTRLVAALGEAPDRARLARVYGELCDAWATGRAFGVPA